MKDIHRYDLPEPQYSFKNQTSTPKPEAKPQIVEKPKVTFPVGPIRIENGSKKPDGKTKGPKKIKGQISLWPSS